MLQARTPMSQKPKLIIKQLFTFCSPIFTVWTQLSLMSLSTPFPKCIPKYIFHKSKIKIYVLRNRCFVAHFWIYKCITKWVFHNRFVNLKTYSRILILKKCFKFSSFKIGVSKCPFQNVFWNIHYGLQVYYGIPILKQYLGKGVLRLIKDNFVHIMKKIIAWSRWWSA